MCYFYLSCGQVLVAEGYIRIIQMNDNRRWISCVWSLADWLCCRELQSTRDLLWHQVNSAKGEMQEKAEQLSANSISLDVVVSKAEQMRSATFICCFFMIEYIMFIYY